MYISVSHLVPWFCCTVVGETVPGPGAAGFFWGGGVLSWSARLQYKVQSHVF